MEIGLSVGVSPREEIRRFVALIRDAEASGVDHIWVIDSQLAMKDAFVAMSVGAWETAHLCFGTGVTNLQTRHPSVLANSFATLETMAPGRIIVGLGAGDSSVFPLGRKPSTISDLRDGISTLRALLRGEQVTRGDESYKLSYIPASPPPIYLSASQPRMLELAGELCDGVIVMGAANRELISRQLAHVRQGIRAGGRRDKDVKIDVWAAVSVDEGTEGGISDVKSWASAKARWMSTWKELPPSLEKFRPEMEAAHNAYDFGTHLSVKASHAEQVSDDLALALAVAGSPAECTRRLSEIAALGADMLTLTLLSGGREQRLRTLMQDVVPGIRASLVDSDASGGQGG